jgi:nucleoside 2-deoxyribosyltransferase
MRVYLGGPINGCSDQQAKEWRGIASERLHAANIETVDPMCRDYRGRELEHGISAEIVQGDLADIDRCDVCLFACPRPSYGTAMEIFYASRAGKRVIVFVANGNTAPSPWLVHHASTVVQGLEMALSVVLTMS